MNLKYLGENNEKYFIEIPAGYSIKNGVEGIFKARIKFSGKNSVLSIAKFRVEGKENNKYRVNIFKWGTGWNKNEIDFAFIKDSNVHNLSIVVNLIKEGIKFYGNNDKQKSLNIFLNVLKIDPGNSDAITWVNKLGNLSIDPDIKSKFSEELIKKMNFPEDFYPLISKAKKVYLNSQGFWEAEMSDGIILIHIPVGKFTMGSDNHNEDEEPVHKVFLNGFWIAKYEITSELYLNYYKESDDGNTQNDFYFKSKFPASNISWYDASNFCKWLSKKSGLNLKLPTEAQWEKAARGNKDNRAYPWGWNDPPGRNKDLANLKGEVDGSKHYSEVASFQNGASPYGVINMSGNASEWVRDWYDPNYYSKSKVNNPEGPKHGEFKIIRGGSYIDFDFSIRVSARDKYDPESKENFIGFRIILER